MLDSQWVSFHAVDAASNNLPLVEDDATMLLLAAGIFHAFCVSKGN